MKKLALTLGFLFLSSLTHAEDAVYRAVIDGHINALISVQTNDGEISGKVQFDTSGADDIRLTGKPGAPGHFKWEEDLGKPTGTFTGTLAPDGKSGQGTWTSANGKKRFPLALSRVATIQDLEDKKNNAGVSYPQLDDPHFARLNEQLAKNAREKFGAHVELMKDIRADLADQRSDPAMAELLKGASAGTGCDLGSVTQGIISILCATSEYTGGAHGNTYKEVLNYRVAADGTVRPIGLWELLKKPPANIRTLSRLILADLKRHEASGASDNPSGNGSFINFQGFPKVARTGSEKYPSFTETVAKGDIVFSVVPAGLAFEFDPYEMGSYDEGSFRVVVPNSELAALYRRDGPLADRTAASQPAARKPAR